NPALVLAAQRVSAAREHGGIGGARVLPDVAVRPLARDPHRRGPPRSPELRALLPDRGPPAAAAFHGGPDEDRSAPKPDLPVPDLADVRDDRDRPPDRARREG